MERLRQILSVVNTTKVAEVSGISYQILANFKKGKKKYLTDVEFNATVEAIKTLTNMKGGN